MGLALPVVLDERRKWRYVSPQKVLRSAVDAILPVLPSLVIRIRCEDQEAATAAARCLHPLAIRQSVLDFQGRILLIAFPLVLYNVNV